MWLKIRHMDTVFRGLDFFFLYRIFKQIFNIFKCKKMLDKLSLIFRASFVSYCDVSKKYYRIGYDNRLSCCKIFLSTGFQQ